MEKNLGKTLIRSTNDGELLPNNLDVKFKTVAGNTNVVSGNYQASISITTTIK
ncbi:TPA: CS3 fimbrial subunit A [Escherichia coli]|nr:CS3 fimbrial subunit A [Escherichia coli]